MNRFTVLTRALWLLAPLLSFACGDNDGGGQARRLVLFHTNDEHSHLFGFAPEVDDFPIPDAAGDGSIVGNVARRAEVLDAQRAALPDGVDSLTVSAGDQTQGALPQVDFTTTSPDLALMPVLGYDVMCPGNHEFDRGPDAYAAAIEGAAAAGGVTPLVSSNIHFSDDPGDDDLQALYGDAGSDAPIQPYRTITTPSGIKVGFIGIMGVNASFVAPLKAPVRFSAKDDTEEGNDDSVLPEVYADLQPVVDTLRNQEGVNVVVALSHGGVNTDQPELGEDYQIASHVAGIDLIVSGHTHTALAQPQIATGPDGHPVPIVQAGAYGRYLGRVELVLNDGERPSLDSDQADTKLIPIDDTIVPSNQQVLTRLDDLVGQIEADVLPAQLSRIEGTQVTDDPGQLGDLYYRPMGATDFDVVGLRSRTETDMLDMSTDSMLATAEELVPDEPTLVAVQASGSVRDDIRVGKTGVLSYADLFRIFPLGVNPVDGTAGYPLTRFYVFTVELKAAFELGVSRGYIDDSLFLGGSGIRVEYDTSRPAQDLTNPLNAFDPQNGRITRILIDSDHSDGVDQGDAVAVFDINRTGSEWNSSLGNATSLVPVVTTLYIASFAGAAGVTLKDKDGQAVALADTILRRGDGSDVKDDESFIRYVQSICQQNGGMLPARYDENSPAGAIPRRLICTGPLCVTQ